MPQAGYHLIPLHWRGKQLCNPPKKDQGSTALQARVGIFDLAVNWPFKSILSPMSELQLWGVSKQHSSPVLPLSTQCLYWRTWNTPTSSRCTTSSTPNAASLWSSSILWVPRQFSARAFRSTPPSHTLNMDRFELEHWGCCVFQDSDLKQYLDNCGNLMSMHNVKVSHQRENKSAAAGVQHHWLYTRERKRRIFTSVQRHVIQP